MAILWWHVASKEQACLFDPCVLIRYKEQRNESCECVAGGLMEAQAFKRNHSTFHPPASSCWELGVSYFTLLIDACGRYFKILKCLWYDSWNACICFIFLSTVFFLDLERSISFELNMWWVFVWVLCRALLLGLFWALCALRGPMRRLYAYSGRIDNSNNSVVQRSLLFPEARYAWNSSSLGLFVYCTLINAAMFRKALTHLWIAPSGLS